MAKMTKEELKRSFENEAVEVEGIVDFGNGLFKSVIVSPHNGQKIFVMPHSISPIEEHKWHEYELRHAHLNENTGGALRVGKDFYAVGLEADHFNLGQVRLGGHRYTHDYYLPGVLAMLMLGKYDSQFVNVHLAVSHAPGHVSFAPAMTEILAGIHRVETPDGRVCYFRMKDVITFDEPRGSFLHYTHGTSTLEPDRRRTFEDGRFFILDIGTGSTDYTEVVVKNGTLEVINSTNVSDQIGLYNVYGEIADYLRVTFREDFANDVPRDVLEEAVRHGTIFNGQVDVSVEVERVINGTVATINRTIRRRFHTLRQYTKVILTGGGGEVLYTSFVKSWSDGVAANIVRSDLASRMYLANVLGGLIYLRIAERENGKY